MKNTDNLRLAKLLRDAATKIEKAGAESWPDGPKLERHARAVLASVQEGSRITQGTLDAAHRAIPHLLADLDPEGTRSMRHIRTAVVALNLVDWASCCVDASAITNEIDRTIRTLRKLRTAVASAAATDNEVTK